MQLRPRSREPSLDDYQSEIFAKNSAKLADARRPRELSDFLENDEEPGGQEAGERGKCSFNQRGRRLKS